MRINDYFVMASILVYLGGMIFLGLRFTRKNRSTEDFYLGGRKLGPLVTAMSAEASDMSAYLLMGLPGVALLSGLPEAVWTAIGLAIGTYLNWRLVAKRIRDYSNRLGAVTVPDFFSKRYHDDLHMLSLAAALIIIVFFVPYTASGFNACGTLFSSLFGVDYFTAMIISAGVIVLYTALGGFLAASATDLIQSVIMTLALIVVVVFGSISAGGWNAVMENARGIPGYLNLTQGYDFNTGTAGTYSGITIVSTLAWGLGYFGMPHILLRFMAIENPRKLSLSRRVATVWVVISMGMAVLIGIIGNAMIGSGVLAPIAPGDSQRIIINISEKIASFGCLPAIVAGLIFAGILAATMSTADSQLLAASSSVTQDIMASVFKLRLNSKASIITARCGVAVIALISAYWAREEGSVFTIVSFAWAGFGAAFGPGILLSLFWKRGNKWGCLAGMLSGGATVFLWKYAVRPLGGVWDIYELLPAFVTALLVNVLVSLLTRNPSEAEQREFSQVSEMIHNQ